MQVPVLHMCFGEIDVRKSDLKDINIIYFIRAKEDAIPPFDTFEECCTELPSYILVGSLNGKFLCTLNRILTQVSANVNFYLYYPLRKLLHFQKCH